jgi:hypothetical protein
MSRSHRCALAFLAVVWVAACMRSVTLAPDGSAPSSTDATVDAAAAEAGESLFDGSVAEADIAEAMDESGDAGDAEACIFLDAYVPSAPIVPGCGLRTPLFSCAPAHSCALSPELVACDAATDCTTSVRPGGCGCGIQVLGIHKDAAVPECPATQCLPPPPPPGSGPGPCFFFMTQRCELVDSGALISVSCVDHQCVTSAIDTANDP